MHMRPLGAWTLFVAFAVASISPATSARDEAANVRSLLDRIGSEDAAVSANARRELVRLDRASLTEEVRSVLIDAVLDTREAVQEAAVWKLLGLRDSEGRPVLDELYDTPAEVTKKTRPRYPVAARSRRIQGRVVLQFMVDANGEVQDIRVLRSIPALDDAAMDCLRRWSFEPATRRGRPVPSITIVPIDFFL